MLCAAILDPFEGPNYRLCACLHQAFLCPALCKLYCYLFQPAQMKDAATVYNDDDRTTNTSFNKEDKSKFIQQPIDNILNSDNNQSNDGVKLQLACERRDKKAE